jgi:hypothetical protein
MVAATSHSRFRVEPPDRGVDPYGNGPAVLGVALGILDLVLLGLPGVVLGPVAAVCGLLGLVVARRTDGDTSQPLAAIVLGFIGIMVGLVWLALFHVISM